MHLRKVNEEVYVAEDAIVHVGPDAVAFVKEQARKSQRGRARICAHRSNDEPLHEMIIAISSASYIRPHRHIDKAESFHVVEGSVDVAVFDEDGTVIDVIELGEPGSGRDFYYRLSDSAFHTLLIRSDLLVIHEVINGPFDPSRTIFAPFAPSEDEAVAAQDYLRRVSEQVARHGLMTAKTGFLVVGGDSLVGGGVVRALRRRGYRTLASTRRVGTVDDARVKLDFEDDAPFSIPSDIDYAYVVAAATNYDRCEKDPNAHRINVELIPRLVASLLEQGVFVTFISTNSVFGGDRPWPAEEDPHEPGIAYAKQKSEGEKVIRASAQRLSALERLNIVRLTKILNRDTSPLPAWFAAWQRGEAVQPFSDLVFAPMSVRFVGEALATIGEKRIPGQLHLSGAENVSYVDLANALAERLGFGRALIAPTTAVERGVNIPFKPRYSGLGMRRTTGLSGIEPQALSSVVDDLLAEGGD